MKELSTITHFRALSMLERIRDNPGGNMSSIGKAVNLRTNKVCEYTLFFEKKGWVNAEKVRQMKLYTLTDKGDDAMIVLYCLVHDKRPPGIVFARV